MIVLTLGTFDLFHAGHVHLLRRCRDLAGPGDDARVIVALNPDDFVERFKRRRAVIPYADRECVLAACRFVDAVIPNIGGEDARPAIVAARPDVIAVGSDWYGRDYLGQLGVTQEWLDAHGVRIVYFPYTEGISSSAIRARVS